MKLLRFPDALDSLQEQQTSGECISHTALCGFSILDTPHAESRRRIDELRVQLREAFFDGGAFPGGLAEERALGCYVCNFLGDSLGAPLEFSPVRYDSTELRGLDHTEIWSEPGYNKFGIEPGQWTDDASMAQAMADSLLFTRDFDPLDLRVRFEAWWLYGYCNTFGRSNSVPSVSIGLGSNISASSSEFRKKRTAYSSAGNRQTSGNGSVMRSSPVPIFFWRDPERALDAAAKQSRTTHQGDEAAECSRLLAHIIVHAIAAAAADPGCAPDVRGALDRASATFRSHVYSVQCLAESRAEEAYDDDSYSNAALELADRVWTWREPNYRYCASRASQQPTYVGSYAMDATAMALHCIWSTDSLPDAMLKCANMRGDSDSVCAVTGQLAGALYGIRAVPASWMRALLRFDGDGDTLVKGHLLFHANAPDFVMPSWL